MDYIDNIVVGSIFGTAIVVPDSLGGGPAIQM